MDELAKQLYTLRDEIEPEWDDSRSERLFAAMGTLRRRRRRQRVLLGAVSMVGLLALGGAAWQRSAAMPSQHATALAAASAVQSNHAPAVGTTTAAAMDVPRAPRVQARVGAGERAWLSDGSLVQVTSSVGVLEVLRDDASEVGLRLLSGQGHFEVVRGKSRAFVVDAGEVSVSVVGTVFDVARVEGRVRVAVAEGKVRVTARANALIVVSVVAGEERWFDAAGEASPVPSAIEAQAELGRKAHAVHRDSTARAGAPLAAASWRSLTQAGKYDEAYRSLAQGAVVDDDASALMDAADAARLSGHPEMATTFLRRVAREHRHDPVAPLAAFTLGRVLLERLGQPAEAAEAFASARSLSPYGSLVQDALAREVEALSKAGNAHEAFLRARAYVEAYPNGRRLHAVQLYGGLARE